jgi:hypothetical protein
MSSPRCRVLGQIAYQLLSSSAASRSCRYAITLHRSVSFAGLSAAKASRYHVSAATAHPGEFETVGHECASFGPLELVQNSQQRAFRASSGILCPAGTQSLDASTLAIAMNSRHFICHILAAESGCGDDISSQRSWHWIAVSQRAGGANSGSGPVQSVSSVQSRVSRTTR